MNLKRQRYLLIFVFLTAVVRVGTAQTASPTPTNDPTADVTRERKEQAYAKLMEGQRYLWRSNPMRQSGSVSSNVRTAKQAFQKAVELDPTLAEGYTALAEVSITLPPNDIDDAINLATIAIKINPNNFGGHRILARLYTFKSRLNLGTLDQNLATKAIFEWKEVARLDPRNAEAWAILSEFYSAAKQSDNQIEALKRWVASASPLETSFYRNTMRLGDLSPERASIKLGTALVAAGRSAEAVAVLSEVVADNPDNGEAIDLLREALETAGPQAANAAITSLGQAIFADPENVSLVNLLSQIYVHTGRMDQAVKVLRDSAERSEPLNTAVAAQLNVSLGDLYSSNDKVPEAIAAYEKALSIRGIRDNQAVSESDRDFVVQVFEKMIKTYKNANRAADVRAVIERARKLLGKDDLFADRQVIALYRETGRRQEAMSAIRAIRTKYPNDYGLLRLEASILTEAGMVDQAVALIKDLMTKTHALASVGADVSAATPVIYDDFTNLLFISRLYGQADREVEAAEAANQAYAVAGSEERKQIAKLTLAAAQQMSGDFASAEATLREILKQTPGNPIALNNLGYLLLEQNKRVEEALALIERALKVDPTNASYLDSLGWAQFIMGNFEEAERNLRTAARLDSSSWAIHEHLGDVYGKQGKLDKAKSAWQRALDLATNAMDISRLKTKLRQ